VRECHVIVRPAGLRDAGLWKGLTAICMLMGRRVVDGVESVEFRAHVGQVVVGLTPRIAPRNLGVAHFTL
jgi:hypothetical protein